MRLTGETFCENSFLPFLCPTFDPSRPKTVPEEMKLGEDDSGEAQARISPEQLVCQQISSSSQVRLSFSNVNIDVVHTIRFVLFKFIHTLIYICVNRRI